MAVPGNDQQNNTQSITVQQMGVQALNLIAQKLGTIFTLITGTSSTATAGGATLPADPEGFIIMTLPDGTLVKLPYYLP